MGFLVDAIGSIFGTNSANKKQNEIAQTYVDVGKQAQAGYGAFNTQTRADFAPYAAAGTGALTRMTNMETPGFQYSPSDPSYAWRLGQGQRAVDQSAAAKGGLFSGGTLKALTNYGQGMASTEFNNDFTRNATLAGYGLDAARADATAGGIAAEGNAKSLFDSAQGRASAYNQEGKNSQSMWGGLTGIAQNQFGGTLDKIGSGIGSAIGSFF